MTILVAIAALFMGVVLGTLGGGGSILAVPILVYLVGLDEKSAIATSLLVVGATSLMAMFSHAREGNVAWKIGALFGVFAMIGSAIGGWSAQFIPGSILLSVFAGFMVLTSVMMFRKKKRETQKTDVEVSLFVIAVEGIVVGAFTGLVGAGGGFLVVPALVLLGGLSMKRAIGTSLMVIAMKSASGFAAFASHVEIDFTLAAMFLGFAVVGSLIGQQISKRIDATRLRTIFAGFVLLMGVIVLSKQLAITWWIPSFIGLVIVGFTATQTVQKKQESV